MVYLLLYTFSCWEKFGENEHRPQIITIQNEDAWQRVVKDETVVVKKHSYLQRRCLGSECDEEAGRV